MSVINGRSVGLHNELVWQLSDNDCLIIHQIIIGSLNSQFMYKVKISYKVNIDVADNFVTYIETHWWQKPHCWSICTSCASNNSTLISHIYNIAGKQNLCFLQIISLTMLL